MLETERHPIDFCLQLEYAYWKTLKNSYGWQKANEICIKAWEMLAVSSFRRAMARLGLEEVKCWKDFVKVVEESIPRAIERDIHEETSSRLVIRYIDCPWYKFVRTQLDDEDRPQYEAWLMEAQRRNCLVRVRESGLSTVSGRATAFMCSGDPYCELVYTIQNKEVNQNG